MSYVHVARGALTRELCAAIVPRLEWQGSLGPAGPGNRCTHGVTWCEDEPRRGVFGELWQAILGARVLPLEVDQVAHWRGWASSTPSGVPIERHAHDGDVVVCVYLAVPEDPEPLEFVERAASGVIRLIDAFEPTSGMVLLWPSSLEHRVPAGERRAGERVCAAFNLTLRRDA